MQEHTPLCWYMSITQGPYLLQSDLSQIESAYPDEATAAHRGWRGGREHFEHSGGTERELGRGGEWVGDETIGGEWVGIGLDTCTHIHSCRWTHKHADTN